MLQEREMDRPERWSARRKSEIVMRLLRGKDLGELSREIEVPPHTVPARGWRRAPLGRGPPPRRRVAREAAFAGSPHSPGPTVTWLNAQAARGHCAFGVSPFAVPVSVRARGLI